MHIGESSFWDRQKFDIETEVENSYDCGQDRFCMEVTLIWIDTHGEIKYLLPHKTIGGTSPQL